MTTTTDVLLGAILNELEQLPDKLKPPREIMDLDEFCQYTGTSKRYSYRLTSENRVPHYKLNGKKIFFKRSEVDQWLTTSRVQTTEKRV